MWKKVQHLSPNFISVFVFCLIGHVFQQSDQDSGKRQKIESDAAGACDLPNNIENHVVDPSATEDGDGSGAFEDHIYAEVSYDDYDGNGDEDFGYYEDFDFSYWQHFHRIFFF